jgi:hypothetical protein
MNDPVLLIKPSIELHAYEVFCRKFENGEFGTQRFGQAFYNEFSLHKVHDQTSLKNLYAKDGQHARNSIKEIFQFT